MAFGKVSSLDSVEAVIELEDILEIEISDQDAERFSNLRTTVDTLEYRLRTMRPSLKSANLLRNLAKSQNNPKLGEGLEDRWRREQIEAVVRELIGDIDWGSNGEDEDKLGIGVRAPKRPPSGRGFAAASFDE
jgi:hypothetical protein